MVLSSLRRIPIPETTDTNTETYYTSQDQFNDEVKYNSIKLLACCNNLFESIRLANAFWILDCSENNVCRLLLHRYNQLSQ